MIKAEIDHDGFAIGFYHSDQIAPEGAVDINDEAFLSIVGNQRSYRFDGTSWQPHSDPVTAEQLIEGIRAAVQAHIDTTARGRLYDNGNSLASYVASTNPTWAAEAQVFVAWRDAVWAQVYALWAAPPEPWPTPDAVIADLPAISWPA